MTKRERRYHQQKKILRALDRFGASLERYLARQRPVPAPKYPLGTIPERGPEVIDLPAYCFEVPAHALPHLTMPPPVQIWAVDKEGGISQISVSQMLQTLDYWAQNKEL